MKKIIVSLFCLLIMLGTGCRTTPVIRLGEALDSSMMEGGYSLGQAWVGTTTCVIATGCLASGAAHGKHGESVRFTHLRVDKAGKKMLFSEDQTPRGLFSCFRIQRSVGSFCYVNKLPETALVSQCSSWPEMQKILGPDFFMGGSVFIFEDDGRYHGIASWKLFTVRESDILEMMEVSVAVTEYRPSAADKPAARPDAIRGVCVYKGIAKQCGDAVPRPK